MNPWTGYRVGPSPTPTSLLTLQTGGGGQKPPPFEIAAKSATTYWAHHVGSSRGLITIVVMTLFNNTVSSLTSSSAHRPIRCAMTRSWPSRLSSTNNSERIDFCIVGLLFRSLPSVAFIIVAEWLKVRIRCVGLSKSTRNVGSTFHFAPLKPVWAIHPSNVVVEFGSNISHRNDTQMAFQFEC